MLLLDDKVRSFEGLTVFTDHADPLQYYYLPLAPHLTTVMDGHVAVPQLSLIRFRGQAGTGGFLDFDVNLGASEAQLAQVRQRIQQEARLRELPRLAPVPTPSGTVKLIMLGTQSGEAAAGPRSDGPRFVLKMDHHASPSLYGNNQAAFSVKLDQEGVTVIERSLAGEILPIAVVYSLNYIGLRPAYSIRVNIDWQRVQSHMEEHFKTNALFVAADIGKAVDELEDKRAIVFEADTFLTEDDANRSILDRRDAAMAQVRGMITDAFFTPSLPPFEAGKEDDWDKALEVVRAIAAGPAGAATSNALFSYSRMDYKRVDKKVLNVDFSERVAVQRTIHPQGHLAGLFRPLRDGAVPRERFITDVTLDDPWFQKRRLAVVTTANFELDGIASINVQARYGDQPKNVLLSAGAASASFDWLSVMDGAAMRRPVTVQYEVLFKDVDATERPRKLVSEPFESELDTLTIDPRALYGMSAVPIEASTFPWDQYPSVEAHLRYQDPGSGLDQREVFKLTKEKPEALWRILTLDARKRSFDYRLVYRAADHRDVDSGWRTTDEEQVTIRDPFPKRRELDVVPNVNWNEIDQVFVDLRYEDPAHDVSEEGSLHFTQGSAPQRFKVSVQDPTRKQVQFKVTFLFKDGRMVEVPESTTLEKRIVVRPDMRGRRIIELRPPRDFAARSVRRVSVDVRYEDFTAGLSFADAFVFEDPSARGFFEFEYLDEARDRYEVRATYLYDNGLERAVDWSAQDTATLQLESP